MSPEEMIESEAVAVTFGNRILGAMTWLMPLSVTISTFGSANGTLFAAGRYESNHFFKKSLKTKIDFLFLITDCALQPVEKDIYLIFFRMSTFVG